MAFRDLPSAFLLRSGDRALLAIPLRQILPRHYKSQAALHKREHLKTILVRRQLRLGKRSEFKIVQSVPNARTQAHHLPHQTIPSLNCLAALHQSPFGRRKILHRHDTSMYIRQQKETFAPVAGTVMCRPSFGPSGASSFNLLFRPHLPHGFPATNVSIMPTVAVIGASSDRSKWGNKSVRAFQQRGYTVYPINPNEPTIEGLATFRSISDVPARPDLVTVYVRPQILLGLLTDIAAKGCDELWLNPGTESDAVLAEAERLKLNVIQACSIIGIGVSPSSL
jgi:uncharacterized protein